MGKITVVGVRLYNDDTSLSKKVYDFKNNCEFKIKKGDNVIVKVGTGGTTEGIVEYIKEKEKETGIKYKSIVEVIGLKTKQEILKEGNSYICDIRIWGEQWSSEGGYKNQWSDSTIKCLYSADTEIKIGDVVMYEGKKAKVVNLRQISSAKTKKLKYIITKNKPNKNKNSIGSVNKNNNDKLDDKEIYQVHLMLAIVTGICGLISVVYNPLLPFTIILLVITLYFTIKNWKTIDKEYKKREKTK